MTKHNKNIKQIKCLTASERSGDEVYLWYSADGGPRKRLPSSGYYKLDSGTSRLIDHPVSFDRTLEIRVMEDDDWSANDSLGSTTYTDGYPEGIRFTRGDGGRYEVHVW